jgi:single-stranded-DNA-specific exonuclease
MAAGLTLPWEHLEAFEQQVLTSLAEKTRPEDYDRRRSVDAEIALHQITPRLLDQLESLQPFGQAAPEPLFLARDIKVSSHRIVGGHHRQMVLRAHTMGDGKAYQAIQFNIPPQETPAPRFRLLAFHLRWNRWKGSKRPQLVVVGAEPATDGSNKGC